MAKSKSKSPRRSAPKPKGNLPSGGPGGRVGTYRQCARTLGAATSGPARSHRRRRLCLAPGRPACTGRHASTASRCRCLKGSTAYAMCSLKIPSASPKACRPTMPCSGAPAAWASPRLVKAAHAGVNAALARNSKNGPLKLIEIHREDIDSLPALMALTRGSPHRFIVFCDDLSFDAEDTTYKSLKAVLEGGSKAVRTTLFSTPRRTAAISCRAT